jgi:hypothetical protein
MPTPDITLFAITLFLDLILLFKWKRRRDVIMHRVNRGLRGYVENGPQLS